MEDVLVLLFLFALLFLVVGVIRPKAFTGLLRDRATRQILAVIFGSAAIVFMMLAGALAGINDADHNSQGPSADRAKIVSKMIEETQTVPFRTLESEDPAVPHGEPRVMQDGRAGEKVVTLEVTLVDGKESSRTIILEEVTVEPIDRVVRIGTQRTETATPEIIVFTTQYVDDPEMKKGSASMVQRGANGEKVKVYSVGFIGGLEVTRTFSREVVLVEPIPEIVSAGTKVPPSFPPEAD